MKRMREWKLAKKTGTCFCDMRESWCRFYVGAQI